MKKNVCKRILIVGLFSLLFTMNVQAQTINNSGYIRPDDSEKYVLLPSEQRTSVDRRDSYARGSLISTATASITNIGGGKIEILVETLAHHQCDEIFQVAYLEQWNEEYQDWDQVANYEFQETADDHPDESFTALTSVVIVDDQPSGYYYRVRGMHKVWGGDISESFSTRTNGVLITKEP